MKLQDCNLCKYVNLTESEQDIEFDERNREGHKSDHICHKFNKRVLHGGQSKLLTRITPCIECDLTHSLDNLRYFTEPEDKVLAILYSELHKEYVNKTVDYDWIRRFFGCGIAKKVTGETDTHNIARVHLHSWHDFVSNLDELTKNKIIKYKL